jgi:hypothetical protein
MPKVCTERQRRKSKASSGASGSRPSSPRTRSRLVSGTHTSKDPRRSRRTRARYLAVVTREAAIYEATAGARFDVVVADSVFHDVTEIHRRRGDPSSQVVHVVGEVERIHDLC